MNLTINRTKKSNSIKNAFNKEFPFLKIEFFNRKHNVTDPSPETEMIKGNISLEDINPAMEASRILLDPQLSVADFEQEFMKRYGLFIQVFRKQKDVWIETTKTDNRTLGEQNEMGKQSSEPRPQAEIADRYLEDGQYE
ncbi:MAG: hypothetical protein ABIN36_16810 [Ferruginibacter sp.]